jgi:RHS repeat-associated protein
LNRVLTKDYNDTTTSRACYAYDGVSPAFGDSMTNPVGHLTSSWSVQNDGTVVAANEDYQFDTMGRSQLSKQCTPGTCGLGAYPTQAGYDLAGNELNYWDSNVARWSLYDTANRFSNFSASFNVSPPAWTATGPGSQALISISAHSSFGGLTSAALGNGLSESHSYSVRGWLGSLSVGSVYSLGVSYAGNGTVTAAVDSENGSWTYQYDGVNRLQTAAIGGQNFNYSYTADGSSGQFGNMTCTAPSGANYSCTPLGLSFNPANNRIAADGLHVYDNGLTGGAGNLTSDGTHGYVYDSENRLTCVLGTDGTCTSSSAMLYFYDPQGNRVGKQQANTLEDYVYDMKGAISSVHDGSTNLLRTELYSDGGHVATLDGSTLSSANLVWNHADWLGTERVRTNSSGSAVEWCTDTPYGMNLNCGTSQGDASPMHFTGLEYDPETGMSHALNRQYPANIGRWLTVDPGGLKFAKSNDPQTWNFYAYVRNNPLTLTDPTGEGDCDIAICGITSTGANVTIQPGGQPQVRPPGDKSSWKKNEITLHTNAGTVHLTVWAHAGAANGDKGMTIWAHAQDCSNCGWVQTVKPQKAFVLLGDLREHTDWNNDVAAAGYPKPVISNNERGMDWLFDSPNISSDNGSKQFVSTLGMVQQGSNSFGTLGSMSWGFTVSGGRVNMQTPRASTRAEQSSSLAVIKRENPTIDIKPQ